MSEKPVLMSFAQIFVGALLAGSGGLSVSGGNASGAVAIGVGVFIAALGAASVRR
jgi:hypothetical protein